MKPQIPFFVTGTALETFPRAVKVGFNNIFPFEFIIPNFPFL